ncbi:hypothetical protein [Ideonella sp.]|uniref:hypothetical protein n=1 Tax=Ideonella sp. TaxID=1929293 RepID=UPI0035B2F284
MNSRLRLLAALSFALVAGGCGMFSGARGPAASPADPSTGSVVVLYHVHLGVDEESFTDHTVYLNGERVGRLNAGEELRLQVGPGISELKILPAMRWLGSTRQDPLKYSIETPKGATATRYMRYRTASGEARITPVTGAVLADRELTPVTELEYSARN